VDGLWPWLTLAALGAYHGLNPAMGWLFAVSLGMQERSRGAVLRALGPILVGHELALVAVAGALFALGALVDPALLRSGAALALIAFGVFRFLRPRAHFRWTRMRVSPRELGVWSFLMATAHGAGLMIAPVLLGTGGAAEASGHAHGVAAVEGLSAAGAVAGTLAHVAAMLLVMGAVALLVYEKLGVAVLRKAWVNTDQVWAASFVLAGVLTLFT
jgi:hypothetical protein